VCSSDSKRANRAGGIHGRRLRLVALDDGYEPARTAPKHAAVDREENVLAVIGTWALHAIAAVPIANEDKTLLTPRSTGAGVLRKNPPTVT